MNHGAVRTLCAAVALMILLSASYCRAEVGIRVMVMDDLEKLTVVFPGSYDVKDLTGLGVVTRCGEGGSRIELGPDTRIPRGVRIRADGSMVSINQYALTGTIDVKRNSRGLFTIINELGLEDYTRAVVGEEMNPGWPIEALKAQAVATRTYALYRKLKGGQDGYDLCSTVNSQVFTGDAWLKDGPARAVDETKGQVLTYQGAVAETLYSSSCGGKTEDASLVWSNGCGYLPGVACGCNSQSPYASWSRTVTAGELESALKDAGYKAAGVRSVTVDRRNPSGRAASVSVLHSAGTLVLTGNELRRVIGYTKLPSTMFKVQKGPGGFVFTGSGSGHGVGLCQWGAKVMAEDGWTYDKILKHYYPKLTLSRLADDNTGGR
jgi:stage II sporulation protein D (peptidoglycan lytic transglycosylase)